MLWRSCDCHVICRGSHVIDCHVTCCRGHVIGCHVTCCLGHVINCHLWKQVSDSVLTNLLQRLKFCDLVFFFKLQHNNEDNQIYGENESQTNKTDRQTDTLLPVLCVQAQLAEKLQLWVGSLPAMLLHQRSWPGKHESGLTGVMHWKGMRPDAGEKKEKKEVLVLNTLFSFHK